MYAALIRPEELLALFNSGAPLAVFDTRFSLADPGRGRADYADAHIPTAIYAHLDADLSGPVVPGQTGRHPLPDPEVLAAWLGAWGVDETVQVVIYDDKDGGIAARLWWMLRWLGHTAAAVLDGGWSAWQAAGLPTDRARPAPAPRTFLPRPRPDMMLDSESIMAMRNSGEVLLVDSRTADRFAGRNETIDPVAGHIPGAANLPYTSVTHPDGRSLPPARLQSLIRATLGLHPPEAAVLYCGSGVTACRLLLAFEIAGLPGARLYPGSWSEWIARQGETAP